MEIEGYKNYLIYPDGRVYSRINNKFLKPQNVGAGYHKVFLGRGVNNGKYIHILVASHYIGSKPSDLHEIDHIDRNKHNNTVKNLRWVTKSDNQSNKGIQRNNCSGHKGISQHKKNKLWKYARKKGNRTYLKNFKTKKEALCYKYIVLLKIKILS